MGHYLKFILLVLNIIVMPLFMRRFSCFIYFIWRMECWFIVSFYWLLPTVFFLMLLAGCTLQLSKIHRNHENKCMTMFLTYCTSSSPEKHTAEFRAQSTPNAWAWHKNAKPGIRARHSTKCAPRGDITTQKEAIGPIKNRTLSTIADWHWVRRSRPLEHFRTNWKVEFNLFYAQQCASLRQC